ncbi:hypothetical protein V6N13_123970 [Hibiscus sabdariffa]
MTGLWAYSNKCFIGHNYPTKALCDPGASINLMPKSVFQKLGIGEAKPTTVMLQLADHSYVQPEGKIEDILVQVDKFIFPTDFLILDCEADECAPIILGRPFLSTSRAVIDFDNDEIIFKVENNSVKMKSLTKKLNKGKGIAESPAKDTLKTKIYMGAHVERDRATIPRHRPNTRRPAQVENISSRYLQLATAVKARLNELGWFRLARQPAQANYNWVIEFYANNAAGEDFLTVRGRRVPATAATINAILGLPNDEPSFYAMLGGFEEEDYETVDRTRLLLINTILTGYRVNIGEILAQELAAACANDKGILAFPCLVSALCRRAAVPTFDGDKYQPEKTGRTRAVYMRKMDLADAIPINVAMPTPPASPTPVTATPADDAGPSAPVAPAEQQRISPPVIPVSSQTTTNSLATTTAAPAKRSRDKTPDTSLGSTPSSSPSPPAPAQTEEAAPPLRIMQLRSQLQRIEARQITL